MVLTLLWWVVPVWMEMEWIGFEYHGEKKVSLGYLSLPPMNFNPKMPSQSLRQANNNKSNKRK